MIIKEDIELFYELAYPNVSVRNRIVTDQEIRATITQAINNKSEGYRSLYLYDEEIKEHLKIKQTIKTFRGNYYLKDILFDIDKGTNTDVKCKEFTKYFVDQLIEDWGVDESLIQIFWSGNKGYHVTIPDIFQLKPSNVLPGILTATMAKHFPNVDQIYDHARIVRLAYTINHKSGLYKVPLTLEELYKLPIEEIKALAITPRTIAKVEDIGAVAPNMHNQIVIPELRPKQVEAQASKIALGNIITCIQSMWNEGPVEGSRHTKMLRMVGSWCRNGIPKTLVYEGLVKWSNQGMEPYEVKKIVDDCYDKGGYNYSCKDSLMTKYCSNSCIFYAKRGLGVSPVTAETAELSFQEYVKDGNFMDGAINLKDFYMLDHDFYIFPSEFVLLQGKTGVNKSTLLQNWAVDFGEKTLYYNAEMGMNLLTRRFGQISHNADKDKVIRMAKDKESFFKAFDHIHTVNQIMDYEQLSKTVEEHRPSLLLIDTLEDFICKAFGDPIEHISKELKRIALYYNIKVIAIQHVNKSGENPKDGVNISQGKGSSAAYQKCDMALRIDGDRTTINRTLEVLKGRDNPSFKIALELLPDTFRMKQINIVV